MFLLTSFLPVAVEQGWSTLRGSRTCTGGERGVVGERGVGGGNPDAERDEADAGVAQGVGQSGGLRGGVDVR